MEKEKTFIDDIKNNYKGKKLTILSTRGQGSHCWLTLDNVYEDERYVYFVGKLCKNKKHKTLSFCKQFPFAIFDGWQHFYYSIIGDSEFLRFCFSDFYGYRKSLIYYNNVIDGIEYKNHAIIRPYGEKNYYTGNCCKYVEFETIEEAKKYIDNKC